MSSRKFRKSEKGISATYAKYPQLLENIKQIYKICGENKSEAARRIGVKPQIFDEWVEGRSAPSTAARKAIASRFGVDQYTLEHGSIADPPAEYKKPLDKQRQRLIELALEIAERGEDRVVKHLIDSIGFLQEASQRNKPPQGGGGSASGGGTATTVDQAAPYLLRELSEEDP